MSLHKYENLWSNWDHLGWTSINYNGNGYIDFPYKFTYQFILIYTICYGLPNESLMIQEKKRIVICIHPEHNMARVWYDHPTKIEQ